LLKLLLILPVRFSALFSLRQRLEPLSGLLLYGTDLPLANPIDTDDIDDSDDITDKSELCIS